MKCLRCGYCCKNLLVVIVKDKSLGLIEDNLELHKGENKACKYLKGDGPGNYYCEIHNEKWYNETPCFAHTQFENTSCNCRIGDHIMKGKS